ncbi:hypothetical protein [Mycobacterium sp. ELW1]|uniref:ATP-dependent DNA ligase n=2 Tax=Mycobacteriaceae TaxID=1762 RepID=UPI00336A10E7
MEASEASLRRTTRNTRRVARVLATIPAMYFVFDVLHLDGVDVMRRLYLERRAILDALELTSKPIMTSPYATGISAVAMFDVVRDMASKAWYPSERRRSINPLRHRWRGARSQRLLLNRG